MKKGKKKISRQTCKKNDVVEAFREEGSSGGRIASYLGIITTCSLSVLSRGESIDVSVQRLTALFTVSAPPQKKTADKLEQPNRRSSGPPSGHADLLCAAAVVAGSMLKTWSEHARRHSSPRSGRLGGEGRLPSRLGQTVSLLTSNRIYRLALKSAGL